MSTIDINLPVEGLPSKSVKAHITRNATGNPIGASFQDITSAGNAIVKFHYGSDGKITNSRMQFGTFGTLEQIEPPPEKVNEPKKPELPTPPIKLPLPLNAEQQLQKYSEENYSRQFLLEKDYFKKEDQTVVIDTIDINAMITKLITSIYKNNSIKSYILPKMPEKIEPEDHKKERHTRLSEIETSLKKILPRDNIFYKKIYPVYEEIRDGKIKTIETNQFLEMISKTKREDTKKIFEAFETLYTKDTNPGVDPLMACVANKLARNDVTEYIELVEFINTNNATYKCIDILDTLGKELNTYIQYFNNLSTDELVKKQIETVIRTSLLQLYKSYAFYKDDPFNLTLLDEYYKIIVNESIDGTKLDPSLENRENKYIEAIFAEKNAKRLVYLKIKGKLEEIYAERITIAGIAARRAIENNLTNTNAKDIAKLAEEEVGKKIKIMYDTQKEDIDKTKEQLKIYWDDIENDVIENIILPAIATPPAPSSADSSSKPVTSSTSCSITEKISLSNYTYSDIIQLKDYNAILTKIIEKHTYEIEKFAQNYNTKTSQPITEPTSNINELNEILSSKTQVVKKQMNERKLEIYYKINGSNKEILEISRRRQAKEKDAEDKLVTLDKKLSVEEFEEYVNILITEERIQKIKIYDAYTKDPSLLLKATDSERLNTIIEYIDLLNKNNYVAISKHTLCLVKKNNYESDDEFIHRLKINIPYIIEASLLLLFYYYYQEILSKLDNKIKGITIIKELYTETYESDEITAFYGRLLLDADEKTIEKSMYTPILNEDDIATIKEKNILKCSIFDDSTIKTILPDVVNKCNNLINFLKLIKNNIIKNLNNLDLQSNASAIIICAKNTLYNPILPSVAKPASPSAARSASPSTARSASPSAVKPASSSAYQSVLHSSPTAIAAAAANINAKVEARRKAALQEGIQSEAEEIALEAAISAAKTLEGQAKLAASKVAAVARSATKKAAAVKPTNKRSNTVNVLGGDLMHRSSIKFLRGGGPTNAPSAVAASAAVNVASAVDASATPEAVSAVDVASAVDTTKFNPERNAATTCIILYTWLYNTLIEKYPGGDEKLPIVVKLIKNLMNLHGVDVEIQSKFEENPNYNFYLYEENTIEIQKQKAEIEEEKRRLESEKKSEKIQDRKREIDIQIKKNQEKLDNLKLNPPVTLILSSPPPTLTKDKQEIYDTAIQIYNQSKPAYLEAKVSYEPSLQKYNNALKTYDEEYAKFLSYKKSLEYYYTKYPSARPKQFTYLNHPLYGKYFSMIQKGVPIFGSIAQARKDKLDESKIVILSKLLEIKKPTDTIPDEELESIAAPASIAASSASAPALVVVPVARPPRPVGGPSGAPRPGGPQIPRPGGPAAAPDNDATPAPSGMFAGLAGGLARLKKVSPEDLPKHFGGGVPASLRPPRPPQGGGYYSPSLGYRTEPLFKLPPWKPDPPPLHLKINKKTLRKTRSSKKRTIRSSKKK